MGKQVQIDWKLFLDIYAYFFDDDSPLEFLADGIKAGLADKADKIINRELFSRYKRAPSGEERERLRRQYLDRRGISAGFRTDVETPMPTPPDDF